jgi:hypothetical protein
MIRFPGRDGLRPGQSLLDLGQVNMEAPMSGNKTVETTQSVAEFLSMVEPEKKRLDATELDRIFRETTGFEPRMWGPSIIGYGRYHYKYETGREGDFLATGFSPRKANLSVYIMPGYTDFQDILDRIGKHKKGKSCLYINKLADIDTDVLAELIRAGLDDLGARWPVIPS